MRIFFIGDIFGSHGRAAVVKYLTPIHQALKPDVVIANGENAAHGIGITPKMCQELYDAGVHLITLGNHAFSKKDILESIEDDQRICRPANFPAGTAGRGYAIHTLKDGRKLAAVNMLGNLFMDAAMDDPFAKIDTMLPKLGTPFVFIDFHAEATSEKQVFAHYVAGRASAVIGTHTHVPTSDHRIIPGGTAYMSDVGMTGVYGNSIIGMGIESCMERFVKKTRFIKNEPASGEATLCGVIIDLHPQTGRASGIYPVRYGGALSQTPLDSIPKKPN